MALRNILLFTLMGQPISAMPSAPKPFKVSARRPSPQDPAPVGEPSSVPKAPAEIGNVPDEWKKVTCSNPGVTDASLAPSKRWSLIDAKDALTAANNHWAEKFGPAGPDHIDLTYSGEISNFFNGPEQWNCGDIGNVACSTTVQCDQTKVDGQNNPTGMFILNSFSRLHQILQGMNTALSEAQLDMTNNVGKFTSTFTTKFKDEVSVLRTLVDLLGFTVALGSAFAWNRVATVVLKDVISADGRGHAKDSFNAAIAFEINGVKNFIPTAKTDLDKQNTLEAALGTYFKVWKDTLSDYNKHIFSGDNNPLIELTNLISEGAFNYVDSAGPTLSDLREKFRAIVWAQMISTAWRTNPAEKLWPVILEFDDVPCDQASKDPSKSGLFEDSTAAQTNVCYNGKTYYLVQAVYRDQPKCARECVGGSPFAGKLFQALPGGTIEELKDEVWAGVRLDNFVISSVDAWNTNGKVNGYKMPDPAVYAGGLTDIDNDGKDLEANFGKILQTPGIYQIPVCKQSELAAASARVAGQDLQGKPGGEWWPCNPPAA